MGIQDLPDDEQRRVRWVLGWIDRMAKKYGGTVYDENGKHWDWGQALCRECYGPEWGEALVAMDITTPTWEDIAKAKTWEGGKIPRWVVIETVQ